MIEILRAVGTDDHLSGVIGTAIWLFSFFTLVAYSSLFVDRQETAVQPNPRSMTHQQLRQESKLQSAEVRMGGVYGLLGGAFASVANGSNGLIWITAICCGLVGAFLGHDVKRRVRRLREEFAAQEAARRASMPAAWRSIDYDEDFPI